MRKKIFLGLCLSVITAGLTSCSGGFVADETNYYIAEQQSYVAQPSGALVNDGVPEVMAQAFNKRVPNLNPLIVCRDKQCAPAELSKSKEYIFNALAQLIDNNLDSTALLCEANPQSHVCTNSYLTVPAKVGITPAYVYFDSVKFVDADVEDGKSAFNLALGYNLSYNGQTPTICKPDTAMLYVKNNSKVVLNGNGFKCDMTSLGTTQIRVMFNIDYIDLDYGYFGGYYSIGLSGPAYGGGSGYGLIRLMKDAHPLSPQLSAPKQEETPQPAPVETFKPAIDTSSLEIHDESAAKAIAPVEVKDGEGREILSNSGREPLDLGEEYDGATETPYIENVSGVEVAPLYGKSDEAEFRPYKVDEQGFDSEYREVDIDDLDEYIK